MGTSRLGGENNSAMDSSFLQNLKHDTSNAPRMLTPSELDSLRQHQKSALNETLALIKRPA